MGPLGFEVTDKRLKRAGLDYWKDLKWVYHENWDVWFEKEFSSRVWLFSTKGHQSFHQTSFQLGDTLVFGRETKGLKESLLHAYKKQVVTIPMLGSVRSLNLANAVAVGLYEALRQTKAFSFNRKPS